MTYLVTSAKVFVVPEIAESILTDEQKKNYELLQQKWRDDAYYAAECAAERRMGY